MIDFDGDDPVVRARYILRHGAAAYSDAMRDWHKRNTVATVNGYGIRAVHSMRFGRIYMVDGLNRGHKTLEGAKQMAKEAIARAVQIGDRVRLVKDVENYPVIFLRAGETGTLVRITDDSHWVRLDQHHDELADWNNEIQIWDNRPDNPGFEEDLDPATYYVPVIGE